MESANHPPITGWTVAHESGLQEAVRLHREGKIDAALSIYKALLANAPDHPDILNLCGVALGQVGQYQAALALLERALERAPHVADYHNNLGIALEGLGDFARAIASFSKALEIEPRRLNVLVNRAAAEYGVGAVEDAIDSYKKVLAIAPALAEAHNALGGIMFERQEFEVAYQHLHRAAVIDPQRYGYGKACFFGEQFYRATSVETLQSVRAFLPEINGEFPRVGADRFVVMTACDQVYFREFALALAKSFDVNAPGRSLHIHLYDPNGETEHDVQKLRQNLRNTELTLSWEVALFKTPSYYASIRFLRLLEILHVTGGAVFCIDADSLIRRDIGGILQRAAHADIGAWTRWTTPSLANKMRGGAIFARGTPAAFDYFGRVAAYLGTCLRNGNLPWWTDQSTLYIAYRMMGFLGEPIALASLPDELLDKHLDPASAVWTAVGGDRKTQTAFAAAKDRAARGEVF